MDGMEKDVSAIGGLFLTIMSDLRVRFILFTVYNFFLVLLLLFLL